MRHFGMLKVMMCCNLSVMTLVEISMLCIVRIFTIGCPYNKGIADYVGLAMYLGCVVR